MPEFRPGEEKRAIVEMANPTASPFEYTATLYMGVNMVSMANAAFHLEGHESKSVELAPIVMPNESGIYPVYIDVWSGGLLLGHYQAVEDVIISQLGLNFVCVYHKTSFANEADLVIHMQSAHPGKPYVVYAYLEEDTIPQGERIPVVAKVFIPSSAQAGSWGFMFRFYGTYGTREDCAGAEDMSADMSEGFYMISLSVPTDYITPSWTWVDVPPGTYTVYSRGSFKPSGADRETLWSGVDLGLLVTIV